VTACEPSIPVAVTVTVEPTVPEVGFKLRVVSALACIPVNVQIDNAIRNAIIRMDSFFIFFVPITLVDLVLANCCVCEPRSQYF
jgi:hypothetical protein